MGREAAPAARARFSSSDSFSMTSTLAMVAISALKRAKMASSADPGASELSRRDSQAEDSSHHERRANHKRTPTFADLLHHHCHRVSQLACLSRIRSLSLDRN